MRDNENKSIAFSADFANELNKKAAQIDGRLFMFAYYEPKQCEGETPHFKFMTAVLNLYGLLWDCAPFILHKLLHEPDYLIVPSQASNARKKNSQIPNHAKNFALFIESFRSYYAHNNSRKFLLNEKKNEYTKKWLSLTTGCEYEVGPNTEEQWQKALDSVLYNANIFVNNMKLCLEYVKNSPHKGYIVLKWINNGILFWYYKNKDLVYHILSEKYLSKLNNGYFPEKIYRGDINRWITDGLQINDINIVLERWLGIQAQNELLKNWDIDLPLLPEDVINELVKGIDNLPPPHRAIIDRSNIIEDF